MLENFLLKHLWCHAVQFVGYVVIFLLGNFKDEGAGCFDLLSRSGRQLPVPCCSTSRDSNSPSFVSCLKNDRFGLP